MRSILQVHQAISTPIDDLITYRAMPTRSVDFIDPFLFLNHHGPQVYPPNNRGLPFGPHPHRGFETLTFVLKGDIVHWDSGGSKSKIEAGGIQWMTAGSGLIHSEVSSAEFMKNGGEVEVLQLWMNLPSKLKMTPPQYTGATHEEITRIGQDKDRVKINLVSGGFAGKTGPVDSITGLTMMLVDLDNHGTFAIEVPTEHNILCYVAHGRVRMGDTIAETHQLIEFGNDSEKVELKAEDRSTVIFGHGKPFNEPIVAQGPFVMNTQQEIHEAIKDYHSGKMGSWEGH